MNFSSLLNKILIATLLTLGLAVPVLAEDTDNTAATKAPRKEVIQPIIGTKIMSLEERIASKEAILKTRLDTFKNREKAQITQRVSTNLNDINSKRTDQMLLHLRSMTTILGKVEDRVNRRTPDVKDPTVARTAITAARETIASAEAAVRVQADKDYTVTVTTEGTLKTDTKAVRDRLHQDLIATRKLVIAAKQAVSNAIRAAKSGIIEPQRKEGTVSGQQ